MVSDSSRDPTQLKPLWRAPDTGPALDVLGVAHTYKAMASETGQQFSVWESIMPPRAGTPAHTHTREDEAFYVLSGEVEFEVEGTADPLRLGEADFSSPRATGGTRYAMSALLQPASWCSRYRAPASIACSLASTPKADAPATSRHPTRSLQLPGNMAS